jgi:hypothetical protein
MIILVIVILLCLIVGGVLYWKRKDLFGTGEDDDAAALAAAEAEAAAAAAAAKAALGESCSVKTCESPLVCDEYTMICGHAPVPVPAPVYTFQISHMSSEGYLIPCDVKGFDLAGAQIDFLNSHTVITPHDGHGVRDVNDISSLFRNKDLCNDDIFYNTSLYENFRLGRVIVGTQLFSVTVPKNIDGTYRQVAYFEILWSKPRAMPGLTILKNNEVVFQDVNSFIHDQAIIHGIDKFTKRYDLSL